MVSEKACTKCGTVKCADAFAPRRDVQSGLASWCRECHGKHRRDNWRPEQRHGRKKKIVALKGGKCERCGGVFHFVAFDLHHRNPEEKEIAMSDLQDKAWHRVLAELEKCDLLCSNCHRVEHFELRYGKAGKP